MTRRLSAVAVAAALVLSFAACSKKDDTGTTTATTAAPSSSTTEQRSTDTTEKKSTGTTEKKTTGTTEKKTTGTTSKSGTSKSRSSSSDLTASEQACVEGAAATAGQIDPSVATDQGQLAVVIGNVIVNCITPKSRLASMIVADIKANPLTANLSSSQEECITSEIEGADKDSLAIFVAALYYGQQTGNTSAAKTFEDALNDACGTNISLEM